MVRAGRPRATGRVFTMSGSEAADADDLIQGTCLVNDVPLFVLFDSGATHSFISFDCVKQLGLQVDSLPFDLIVSTPTNAPVTVSTLCSKCPVVVNNRTFLIDLICLPLSQIDVILGMDWLSANKVLLNCFDKTIVFGEPSETSNTPSCQRSMSANEVNTSLKEGSLAYILLASLGVEKKSEIKDVPVVCEFPDVFPDEIPNLPPVREVEFSIDLVPGTGAISIAPYRMAPLELADVIGQLEDLLTKKFIRPSVSPWGAPVLL
ncbi:PREDICTED: uncharacterized protein LOC109337438, partial [Lupinus angustifolius]|uniref:uncharacterized protein LOC109337438 n=1 Tax=Lupinus angustifolius TaxID=3871 RepID=UPI00092F9671